MVKAQHHIQATNKTFEIIDHLQNGGAGVTELSKKTGIGKSSIYKHLDTLKEQGFVIKKGDRYHLSLRFFQLGLRIRGSHEVFSLAKPQIEKLAKETGETVSLIVPENKETVYIHQESHNRIPRALAPEGERLPIDASPGGKTILSFLDQDELPTYLTDLSSKRRDKLEEELKTIERDRICIERSSNESGDLSIGILAGHSHSAGTSNDDRSICCVSVPIRNGAGRPVGAIEVSGSESSLYGNRLLEEIPRSMMNSIKKIENKFD